MRKTVPILFVFMLISAIFGAVSYSAVLNDPCVPDGEQIVWRWTNPDGEQIFSTITWHVDSRGGKPVYKIVQEAGERKQAVYILGKSDLRLVWANVVENTEDGRSEATIEVKGDKQYLTHEFKDKVKEKEIDHEPDGYNGMTLTYCLRGFPFGKKKEVNLKLTPPFGPDMPRWAWKMWKSYAKFLGEEKVTVPAGTFDCYKLEVSASGGLIRRVTSEYYFWYTKEPPYRFVKYQGKDDMTELMEIRNMGK